MRRDITRPLSGPPVHYERRPDATPSTCSELLLGIYLSAVKLTGPKMGFLAARLAQDLVELGHHVIPRNQDEI
jgi:hypothetical protein